MKKLFTSLLMVAGLSAPALMTAQVIFEDSFETYTDFAIVNVGNWTLTDVDLLPTYGFNGIQFTNTGAAKSFQVFNSTTTSPPMTPSDTSDWTARTGNKMMVSFSSTTAPWSNDWLISPQITLPAENADLSFWAKSNDSQYGAERYQVYVSTTGTAIADFTPISSVITTPADLTWHQFTHSLAEYAGQQIYIAIQCTSQDQFGFSVDDFRVALGATELPGCSTQTGPADGATDLDHTSVALSWTAPTTGGAAESYDVYLDTNANPTTLVANVSGTTYTPTDLVPDTTYYWRVVPKNTLGEATGCSTSSFTTAFVAVPDCPTVTSPENGAVDVEYLNGVTVSWTAATTGSAALSYNVYLGTDQANLELLGNTTETSASITGLLPSTTYYWYVTGVNDGGESAECAVYSFTTVSSPFEPYCGPLAFSFDVEPISHVNFAGIDNASNPTVDASPAHEDFISVTGNVVQGNSYDITLQGNTGGNFTNRFAVFIDWNQNGVLNDAGEVYEVTQTLAGSTGADGKQVVHTIAVPADALEGTTRMRVKKIFGTANYNDPCLGAGFGQAEDYSIAVAAMAVSDVNKNSLQVYPNPVADIINVNADSKVKSVTVYDATGKMVSAHTLNAAKNQINLSRLSAGVYIISVETEKGTQSVKVIKK